MAAPNDPNDKSKVTLDLNLNEPSRTDNSPQEVSQIKLRPQAKAPGKPEKSQGQTPVKPMRPIANRGRAKKKNEKNSKPIFILTGIVITAVLVSQYMMNKEIPALESPSAAPPAMRAKATKNVTTESLPKGSTAETPSPTDPYQGIREADLDQMGLEIDEKGRTFFAVRVKPRYVCYPGDIEAIRNVVGSTGSVLLSLEPMAEGGKAKPAITHTLSFNELTQGTKVSLPVDMSQTGIYGIYICGDAAGKKSCGGKPAADFNKILNHRDLNIAANSIFYYQFAVLGLDYATVYSGLPSGIPEAREQLKNQKPQRDWKAELDKASAMMSGVKSLPPTTKVEKNVVTLELPLAMVNPDGSCR
ncbi:MAG TPA: hypothetical protein VFO10_13745 [Oligoflexus sp.]|uniref:hypothetical protein n=1 Tax=Oligoflexus sp. TaxID=1971216 RepID=UPI002D7EF333|nr:hypothetical protein [Oligoflexus sp.]HET9238319.1 hypothetical protein [Oligoflexus sp.]